jgi:tetratricopeptide (TPR) repeat protein
MFKRSSRCVFRCALTVALVPLLDSCAALQEPIPESVQAAVVGQAERLVRTTEHVVAAFRPPAAPVAIVPTAAAPLAAPHAIAAPRPIAFAAVMVRPKPLARLSRNSLRLEPRAIAAAYAYHAERAEATGNNPAAIAALQKSVAVEPGNASRWFKLASLHRRDGNLAGALTALNRAISSDPGNDPARLARAEVEQRLEHFDAAVADFDVYLAHHPGSNNVLRLDIDAARAAGNHPAALAAIDAYLTISPNDLTVLRARGEEFYAAGDEKSAIAAWKVYADRAPADADVLKQIAYASEHAGDFAGAVAALHDYVQLRPHDDRLRLALAYDEARAGFPERSRVALTELKDSPDPDVSRQATAELRARMTTTERPPSSRAAYGAVQYDSRFHDVVFGADIYALAPQGRFVPYFAIHSWDDTRSSARAYEPVIYNDNSEIFGGGVRYNVGRGQGQYFFVEAGEQISLIGRGNSPELRYGVASWSEIGRPGFGHTSFGLSVASYSRYGADVIGYSNILHDFPLTRGIRGVAGTNFAFDTHRDFWNNFGEIELGIKIGSPRLSFTFAGVGGLYLPRGANVPSKPFYTTLRPSITWSPKL